MKFLMKYLIQFINKIHDSLKDISYIKCINKKNKGYGNRN